jgi:sec-independent protein translocase protein TatA
MFDIGPEKVLMILAVALVFLGPKKIPEVARSLGKGLREFRRAQSEVRDEFMGGFDEEVTPSLGQSGDQVSQTEAPATTDPHSAKEETGR